MAPNKPPAKSLISSKHVAASTHTISFSPLTTDLVHHSRDFFILAYPGIVQYKKPRVWKPFWSQGNRVFAIKESIVLCGLQRLRPWAKERFSCEESLSKWDIVWKSSKCPSLRFLYSSLQRIHFRQPCHCSVCDGPKGERLVLLLPPWDCQPLTQTIQMTSLANNPTSKDPFRCPQKDNFC